MDNFQEIKTFQNTRYCYVRTRIFDTKSNISDIVDIHNSRNKVKNDEHCKNYSKNGLPQSNDELKNYIRNNDNLNENNFKHDGATV